MPTSPPAHVLAAFGAGSVVPEQLAGGRGLAFRCADIVFKPVDNTAEASWIAATFEQLRISGIRVARPVRSSDGRWVVAGWSAQRFVSGRTEPRYSEIIQTSLILHEALAGIPHPRYLRDRDDLYSWADRLSWGERVTDRFDLGDGHGSRLFEDLAIGRKPVDVAPQLVHGDMFGNVLFAGTAPPAVIDMTPYWRPASWSAAVIAVDAISWGGAQTDLLQEWGHLPEWPQMLLRALMFRLAVSLSHPRSTPSSLVEIVSAAEIIRPFLP
ncbi:uncharacterized protein (TIGR02569 family) [Nakamurella sp. UYEF19]|uniref:TIGR02569 family protein n=1 Tax=Nakamurella sp. UYEF19 TaxID=1756392 RepID=UPI0033974CFC